MEELSRIGDWISAELGKSNESSAGKATLAQMRKSLAATEGVLGILQTIMTRALVQPSGNPPYVARFTSIRTTHSGGYKAMNA
uniref:Uncharacterized protein n=1 Tax=Tanacetum cinerariifolium TaxID=118510 RepID=A0A699UPG6_TANCI|nr:hypothetical protein [Tanacetum cinerariifolium]